MMELEKVYLVAESCILLAGSCIPGKVTIEMIELEKCRLVLWGLFAGNYGTGKRESCRRVLYKGESCIPGINSRNDGLVNCECFTGKMQMLK